MDAWVFAPNLLVFSRVLCLLEGAGIKNVFFLRHLDARPS